jgi:regulation of enolase protein 1 (concanavalin A-like superfamily)
MEITAGSSTDLFVNPQGGASTLDAPRLLAPVSGDFQLVTHVTVEFAATFDAGALLIWAGEDQWGKLCFEYSPQGNPMVVSVVTKGVSDDANSFVTPDRDVWLRASRVGHAFAFHASLDGRRWEFIRHFALDAGETVELGFEAQSPAGEGCTARFEELRFSDQRLGDLRSGD